MILWGSIVTSSIFIFQSASRVLIILSLTLSGCASQSGAAAGESTTAAPTQVAEFALRDTEGRLVRLSDYVGRDVILINFWATWCGPCAGEMPFLQRLYGKYKEQGLVVLGIAMDGPETVASVAPVARGYGVRFPVLLDEETRVVGVYNPKRTAPLSILIGRSGKIEGVREGFTPGDAVDIEREVSALLLSR
jgi:peroxiredoxin